MLESHLNTRCYPLEIKSGSRGRNYVQYEHQLLLELFRCYAIWIIRRRSEGDWEVAEDNVEEGLYIIESTFHPRLGRD